MTRTRKARKIRHIRLAIKVDDVNDTERKVLRVLFHAGRPMTDTQVHTRARFIWGEDGRSHAAIWRARVAVAKLGLVEDSGHKDGRSICWALTPEGREFVRVHG